MTGGKRSNRRKIWTSANLPKNSKWTVLESNPVTGRQLMSQPRHGLSLRLNILSPQYFKYFKYYLRKMHRRLYLFTPVFLSSQPECLVLQAIHFSYILYLITVTTSRKWIVINFHIRNVPQMMLGPLSFSSCQMCSSCRPRILQLYESPKSGYQFTQ